MSLPDLELPGSVDTFDIVMLVLRIAFIALIYLFLYQVGRVSVRELVALGKASAVTSDARVVDVPAPTSVLELIDPADSSFTEGATFPLDHYTTIGRHPDNTFAIDDDFVSGAHAEILFEGGRWWLQDLDSTNGTLVNGQPVRNRVRITGGDMIQFGRVRFRAHV